MPRSYARIDDKNIVREVIQTYVDENGVEYSIDQMFSAEFRESLIEITGINPAPTERFRYVNGSFLPPVSESAQTTKEDLEKLRLIAYANPVTGVDRYFAEVISLQAEGFAASSSEVKEAKAKGLARKAEIQALYPYPAE